MGGKGAFLNHEGGPPEGTPRETPRRIDPCPVRFRPLEDVQGLPAVLSEGLPLKDPGVPSAGIDRHECVERLPHLPADGVFDLLGPLPLQNPLVKEVVPQQERPDQQPGPGP